MIGNCFTRDCAINTNEAALQEIKSCAESNSHNLLVRDVNAMIQNKEQQSYGLMWKSAYTAPERFAAALDIRFLVIIDELQNIPKYIHPNKKRLTRPDETLADSFHGVSESKIASILVTGSYVGWLTGILDQYLEAGRFKRFFFMTPYLTSEEGIEAVLKYSEYY